MGMTQDELDMALKSIREKTIALNDLKQEANILEVQLESLKQNLKESEKEIKKDVQDICNNTKNFYKPKTFDISSIKYYFDTYPMFMTGSWYETLKAICDNWVYCEGQDGVALLEEINGKSLIGKWAVVNSRRVNAGEYEENIYQHYLATQNDVESLSFKSSCYEIINIRIYESKATATKKCNAIKRWAEQNYPRVAMGFKIKNIAENGNIMEKYFQSRKTKSKGSDSK